ncbi:class F sortase [Streptomyces sp. NPDC006660]|uniref:class F sortase n=1 Tax=Streptomyces sp. NPDC006660 TaxID=3156901 RepID=UPI0033E3860C
MAHEDSGMERRRRSPWGALALVMLTGIALMKNGADVTMGPPQPAAAAAPASSSRSGGPAPAAADTVEPLPFAPASRVRIEAINVDAPLMDVGTDAQGWVQAPPPQDPNLAGWYQNGVAPGMRGTSVIVGHVDNMKGPAVFYGLGSLQKGNHIDVARFDGRTAVFEVYGVEVFSKETFPGARVYGDTGHPELRVITCGGGFSRARGYDGNVVAFARLVSVK